jgi:glycosyltransferase involved in cell wall biosynthesis
MKELLFVYPKKVSFIDLDIDLLSSEFKIHQNYYSWNKKIFVPFFIIHQFFFILFKAKKFHAILISFGGYWALIPTLMGKVFGKPVYIIIHGSDAVSFPELNYGSFRTKLLSIVLNFCYSKADRLLPVSESLVYTENSFYKKNIILKQGFSVELPNLKTPYSVIYNGFDLEKWYLSDYKQNTFIAVFSESQFELKGGDLILAIADSFPNYNFKIVGLKRPNFIEHKPVNVQFMGRKSSEELALEYSLAKYYFQLSSFEGFGCSLCESMLSGCIPIVSSVNILPSIVGDTGYILEERSVDKLIKLINSVVSSSQIKPSPRMRIVNQFSMEKRKVKLIKTIK